MIDSKLNDILNSYDCNDSAYVISDYIKKNMKKIPNMSIGEVSQACFVSKGQISKFVKKLGYESYSDFKDACIDYLEAQIQKKQIFITEFDLKENVTKFTFEYTKMLQWIKKEIDYAILNQLIKSISKHNEVYLFAQGEARSICQILQIELGNLAIPIGINNTDFSRQFCYNKNIMILIISINGRSFEFNKSVIKKILNMPNDTWLITCNKSIEFSKNKLIVPTLNTTFNEFAIRFVIDIIIAELRKYQTEKIEK